MRALLSRVAAVLFPNRADREFDEELEGHLALLAERFIRQGMTPEEAGYAARRQFGGIAQARLDRRERRGFPALEAFVRDARQAIRTLRRSPGFTATAVAALALGMGANVAIFSVVSTVFLKPLTAPDAGRLVRFFIRNQNASWDTASYPQFNFWQQQATIFDAVAAHRLDVLNLTGGDSPEQIRVARVTADFLRIFGAPLLHGRAFTADEDRPGGGFTAVLSHGLWMRRFGGDPAAIGKSIVLGSDSYTVIGIVAPDFNSEQFDVLPEAWVPFQIDPGAVEMGSFCTVTGRLKPGATITAANSQLESLSKEYYGMLTRPNPATFAVEPLREAMARGVASPLAMLAGAVCCVLLIACANVANLLLARAGGRRREIAIRTSVGASRGRIIRQLLTESLVLSFCGGAVGLALGSEGIRVLLRWYPTSLALPGSGNAIAIPRVGEAGSALAMDWRVVLFALLVSAITGILFGLIPALQASRADLHSAMKRSSQRTRSVLVIAETALALVLLVGAALFIRTYVALRSVNPGFDARHVVTAQMSLSATRFEKTSEMARLVQQGTERIRSFTGVESAAAACCIPLETVWQLPFSIVVGSPGTELEFAL